MLPLFFEETYLCCIKTHEKMSHWKIQKSLYDFPMLQLYLIYCTQKNVLELKNNIRKLA